MSVHCEKCGQAKYLANILPKIEQQRDHFYDVLSRIETEVAPNRKGRIPRGAADKVLSILMDDRAYMGRSSDKEVTT